ncbi:MAG: hypothetical protein ACTHU0_19280 [Kofleriaceae bacterium]
MTACVACGHDPEARVIRSWTFDIPKAPSSMNAHVVNAGGARWAYAKERNEWALWIRQARLLRCIPKATGKRRVTFERLYGGRCREWDNDNFVGGLKVVRDALVREGLLVDDNEANLTAIYKQAKRPGETALRITIEELADA